jgi:uncharacterized protein
MANATQTALGSVVSLWHRAYALLDASNGKVASAKYPRKWPNIFDFRATFAEPPRTAEKIPPIRITLPNGRIVTSEQSDLNEVLTNALGREVTLATAALGAPSLEEYWPDMEGLAHRETVTDEAMPAGTFFDLAVAHVLTTATIDRLREFYPQGRFEVRRFRPNIVVQPASAEKDFVENAWVGHRLVIGDEVRLNVTGPCPRCVMTTLPQGDLPSDPGILRTAAQQNQVNVGVYAAVLRGGTIRRGDPVRLE